MHPGGSHCLFQQELEEMELTGLSGQEGLTDVILCQDVCFSQAVKAPLMFITDGKGTRAGDAVLGTWA